MPSMKPRLTDENGRPIPYYFKKRDISEMTPAQAAVIGDVMTGMLLKDIVAKYGIPVMTIQRWMAEFSIKRPPPFDGRERPLPERGDVMLGGNATRILGKRAATVVEYPSYSNVDPETGQTKDIRIQLVDYIQNSLLALNNQLLVGSDPRWIGKQSANDLAAYHRVIGDRLERLIAAFAAGQVEDESFDDEDGNEVVPLALPHVSE